MSSFWNLPRLKRGVDLQVQTAYNDNDWPRVARLAAKRAAISDRQYHEILKTAAETRTDLPVSRYAAVLLATKMLKDGSVITDIESFDLLDWATKDVADSGFFCQVLGPLRLRSVKSGKLNRAAMVLCFEACLRNWDLGSAQQIAAFLDRSFKQERSFLFWNIAVTFLFAASSECAKDKKALYSTLASRMVLKANQDTASAPKNAALQEEEVLVYYGILMAQGSLKEWQDLMQNELLGPVAQCRLGRKEPFLSALRAYEKFDDWSSIYELTKAAMTDPESTEDAWKPSVLASDWALWQYFLKAARHVRVTKPEVVQEVTARIEAASSDSAPAILRRTMILAKILSCFELGEPSEPNPEAVKHMTDMIQNLTVVARFEDLRPLVQRMVPADMYALLQAISTPAESAKPIAVVLKQTLIGKLRFLISTCPGASSADFAAILKDGCASLQSLSYPGRDSAVDEIAALLKDMNISETKPIKAELSPDFAILIAVTLIKLSGLTPGNVCAASLPYILQAIAVLENQLHITPKDHGVLILLVRLHMLIGSARRASEVWDVLDVKRTIVDSLAPLFLDRLSSISPVLVSPTVLASHKIVRTVLSYYDNVLSTKMPKSIVEAIHAKSYSSIIQIPEYIQSLKTSSTRAMGYLERRRATRAFTGKPDEWTVADVPVYSETINFGPFPTLESSMSLPIYETLSLGPPPSNERTQLAILSEKLFSVLAFKPPTMYKPSAAAITAEEAYVTEELTRLANSFGRYLTAADLSAKLTPAEMTYYQTLALLTLFTLSMCPPTTGSGPANKPTVDAIVGSLTDLSHVIEERLSSSSDTAEKTLKFFSSLHDLWYLRDTACAVRTCLDYITLFNSRQKPAKPPAKDDAANMKTLATAAAGALAHAKAWVATAKKTVGEAGFERKVAGLAFGAASEDDGVTEAARLAADIEGTSAANWAKKIVESWKQNIAGWETVKWE